MNISLNDSASLVRGQKATLEKIHNKELTWDDFFRIQAQYLDLPAEGSIISDVKQQLHAIQEHLEKNREQQAANIVEIFGCALTDVLSGKLAVPTLTTAILNAEDPS